MDKSRVEPTIFFIEKISFSLKLFSGHFYGQSFIKTVRGPFKDIVLLRYYDYVYICLFVNIEIKTLRWHIQKSGVVLKTICCQRK